MSNLDTSCSDLTVKNIPLVGIEMVMTKNAPGLWCHVPECSALSFPPESCGSISSEWLMILHCLVHHVLCPFQTAFPNSQHFFPAPEPFGLHDCKLPYFSPASHQFVCINTLHNLNILNKLCNINNINRNQEAYSPLSFRYSSSSSPLAATYPAISSEIRSLALWRFIYAIF